MTQSLCSILLYSPGNSTCLSTLLPFHSSLALKNVHLHICLPIQAATSLLPRLLEKSLVQFFLISVLGLGEEIFTTHTPTHPFFFFSCVFIFVCLLQYVLHIAWASPDKCCDKPQQSWKRIAHRTGTLSGAFVLQQLLFLMSTIMSWESIRASLASWEIWRCWVY